MTLRQRLSGDLGVWIGSFLLVFALAGAWALASPYASAPDEPAHSVRAYAVAHGQFFADHTSDPAYVGGTVRAPHYLADTNPACFAFHPETTADCEPFGVGGGTVEAGTTAARSPVYYYFVIGLPTLIASGGKAIMLMRLWQAALCAALVASALVSARRRDLHRWLPIGVLLAATPMCFYLFGVVNPSGLEIAGAIGVWASGLALVRSESFDRRVFLRFVIAAVVVAGTRQLGPLMLLVIAGLLCLVAGWTKVRELLRHRDVWIGAAVVGCVAVLLAGWVVTQHTFQTSQSGVPPPTISDGEMWRGEITRMLSLFVQAIGRFGWLDTAAPEIVTIGFFVLLGTIVLVSLSLARRRIGSAILALIGVVLVLPILIEVPNFRVSSFAWQGRYNLPLIVGIPLLAAFGLIERDVPRPSLRSLGVIVGGLLLAAAQFFAFAQTLRRYSVGQDGAVFFWAHARWNPTVPSVLLLIGFAIVIPLWIVFILSLSADAAGPLPTSASVEESIDSADPRGMVGTT